MSRIIPLIKTALFVYGEGDYLFAFKDKVFLLTTNKNDIKNLKLWKKMISSFNIENYDMNSDFDVYDVIANISDNRPDILIGRIDGPNLELRNTGDFQHQNSSVLLRKIMKEFEFSSVTYPYYDNVTDDFEKQKSVNIATGELPKSLFHGTNSKNAINILRFGLMPGNESNYPCVKCHYNLVFLTSNFSKACYHSTNSLRKNNNNAFSVVFEFNIPDVNLLAPDYDLNFMAQNKDDSTYFDYESPRGKLQTIPNSDAFKLSKQFGIFGYKGRIPANFIKTIFIYNDNWIPVTQAQLMAAIDMSAAKYFEYEDEITDFDDENFDQNTIQKNQNQLAEHEFKEIIKLASNQNMIRKLIQLMPAWTPPIAAAFLVWLGIQQSPAQVEQEIESNPTQIVQKIQEFDNIQQDQTTLENALTQPQSQTQPQSLSVEPEIKKDTVFNDALLKTLKFEGGYVNHPRDPGGETNKGITKKTYIDFLKKHNLPTNNINMKNIPDNHVNLIYKEIWNKIGCSNLPTGASAQLFDFAVNSGGARAIKYLQTIVGVKQTGSIDDNTINAINKYVKKNGADQLNYQIWNARNKFILNLSKNSKFKPFVKGWMNRLREMKPIINKKSSDNYVQYSRRFITASSESYEKTHIESIADTNRYTTDRFDIYTGINSTRRGIEIGFHVNSAQTGIANYVEYWIYPRSENIDAEKTFNEIKQISIDITKYFRFNRLPMANLSSYFRFKLNKIGTNYKEKSGVFGFNEAKKINTYVEDYRKSLYGNRYPEYEVQMNTSTNMNNIDKSRIIQSDGRNSRNKILKLTEE